MPKRAVATGTEVYQEFKATDAADQASRCSQCGVPFLFGPLPAQQHIPDWLKLTAEGGWRRLTKSLRRPIPSPRFAAASAPQDRLCEGNCVIEKGFDSVTIGAVEKYITDTAWEKGWVKPPTPLRERAQSVGIIGAGPAGLAAAEQLRLQGYKVTVYDRYDRVGGLMIYGIPSFKLEKDVVLRRHAQFEAGGITFRLNCAIGQDITLAELRARHDSVLIATGVYKARDIDVPGAQLAGVVAALDYLTTSNRQGLGDAVPAFESGALNAAGRDVVVVGGGDTAMDCVRTAVRQGARSVTCLYRRDKANMPGSMREVKNAEEEGVRFEWLAAPEAFIGGDKVSGVRAVRMHLGLPDATGRQQVEPISSSGFTIKADLVIKALGFDPEDLPAMFAEPTLTVSRWGTLKIDHRTMMTALPGVFAAGDIVRGASLVVWGIRDGRDAAAEMHKFMDMRGTALAVAAE